MLPLAEVQKVLFDALTVALAPVPVVDHASPDRSYPYVSIGEFTATGEGQPLNDEAIDMDVTIHVWSRQRGMLESQQIMAVAKDALDEKQFAGVGFQWVRTSWRFAQTMRDADGVTRHGVLRFQVMTFLPAVVVQKFQLK